MKARVLKNHIGLIGLLVILVGCGLSDAPQKRAQMDCMNHLKHLGVSVFMEAKHHENSIPRDFLFLTNHAVSPSILICPIDPVRKGRRVSVPDQRLTPVQLQATNISYQLVTPGAKITSSKSEPLVRCPFHRQVSYADGSGIKAKAEESK